MQKRPADIVAMFERSDKVVAAKDKHELAQTLSKEHGGSVKELECILARAERGNRIFAFDDKGVTKYETVRARRRRLEKSSPMRRSNLLRGIGTAQS